MPPPFKLTFVKVQKNRYVGLTIYYLTILEGLFFFKINMLQQFLCFR